MTESKTGVDEQPMLPFDPPLEEGHQPEVPMDKIAALKAENDDLRSAIRIRDACDQMSAALKAAGARSPDLLFAAAKDSLQFGEDGSVQNAEALVSDLRQKFPEQFGPVPRPPIDGGAGREPNELTKEALAGMKPDEIARLDWDAVRQALSSNV